MKKGIRKVIGVLVMLYGVVSLLVGLTHLSDSITSALILFVVGGAMTFFGSKLFKKVDPVKEKPQKQPKGVEGALLEANFNSNRLVKLGALGQTASNYRYFAVDGNAKKFAYYDKKNGLRVFKFDQLLDFEVYQDGSSVVGGGGLAMLAGGAAFGGLGAIAGAKVGSKKTSQVCEDFNVRIKINDLGVPLLTYPLLNMGVDKSNGVYKNAVQQAEELIATIEWIVNNR